MIAQNLLFDEFQYQRIPNQYKDVLTVVRNKKGVIDVDTVKGCYHGMKAYPEKGCYNDCYAYRNAHTYGVDFTVSIKRKIMGREHRGTLIRMMNMYNISWYRIGVSGDPSFDWNHTLTVIRALWHSQKTPIIITKHWVSLLEEQLQEIKRNNVIVNTSVSGMDTDIEISHRVNEFKRLKSYGIQSVLRVVTCKYGNSEWANECNEKQKYLLSFTPVIDNPFRPSPTNYHVVNGDILTELRQDCVGGGKRVSLHLPHIYLGKCDNCEDQCGTFKQEEIKLKEVKVMTQESLFNEKVEFQYVPMIIGSGYEKDVATLALEDGIAHRAARKNMQIHSAIILKINDEFMGFFTFQNNHEIKEFCLLQSVIKPEKHTSELYKQMCIEVLAQNTNNYPAIMTTDPKSKFETPALFESLGFVTYLKMSGFCYMLKGDMSYSRMKLLCHITMCNVWDSTKGEWLKIKKEWKEKIERVGRLKNVPNPMFASRDGCWQGENGFANVVTGHSHNGNASVLDSTACEVILRFFIPKDGKRIYNPFGGGVQFGFVAGSYGYEYLASEIRQNQCDANNTLCSHYANVKWIKGDSSTFEPDGMYDLIFTCPPYYKVETYLDYDGNPPEGELNSLSSYEDFEQKLFAGYKIAIDHLNDNSFFVVMTGDSRDSKGAYYCSEAKTELFLKDCGLHVYNKIVYLEGEFTRLAHAKKTLNTRKFPKREQKIIVAYKGNLNTISDRFAYVGRL